MHRPAALFLFIFAAMIAVHLPALTLIPAVTHDEAAINAAARSWVHTGTIGLTLLAESGATYRNNYDWHPPGHLLAMAAAYRLFGYSIFVTRIESVFFGALAAALFFLLVRKVTGSTKAGVIGALLLASHPLWWWLCRSGRMDTSALAFGFGAFLLWPPRRETDISPGRAAAAGLLLGVAGLFHVLALAWMPAFLAAEYAARRRLPSSRAALYAAAAAAPFCLWVAATFAGGHGNAWIEQFWQYQALQRRATLAWFVRPWAEFHLFLSQFELQPLTALAVLAGAGLGWRKIDPEVRRWWAGGLGVSLFLVTMGMSKGTGAYPLYWYVWLAGLSAAGWAALLSRPAPAARWLLGAGVANALAIWVMWAAVAYYQSAARDPRRIDAFFAAHIRPGSIVVGPEDVWYSVEKAGGSLRIWIVPDPSRHDFYVTHAGVLDKAPAGFHRVAHLDDIMPKVFGRYFSPTAYAYDLWAPNAPR